MGNNFTFCYPFSEKFGDAGSHNNMIYKTLLLNWKIPATSMLTRPEVPAAKKKKASSHSVLLKRVNLQLWQLENAYCSSVENVNKLTK